jgi:hypothetical protein
VQISAFAKPVKGEGDVAIRARAFARHARDARTGARKIEFDRTRVRRTRVSVVFSLIDVFFNCHAHEGLRNHLGTALWATCGEHAHG